MKLCFSLVWLSCMVDSLKLCFSWIVESLKLCFCFVWLSWMLEFEVVFQFGLVQLDC